MGVVHLDVEVERWLEPDGEELDLLGLRAPLSKWVELHEVILVLDNRNEVLVGR